MGDAQPSNPMVDEIKNVSTSFPQQGPSLYPFNAQLLDGLYDCKAFSPLSAIKKKKKKKKAETALLFFNCLNSFSSVRSGLGATLALLV